MKHTKKLVLLLIVLMSVITVFGQTTKGNFILSGGAGLQFVSGNVKTVYDGKTDYEYKTSSFSFIPSFGYFVIDNLAIGLAGNISNTTEKDEDGDKSSLNSILIVPTAMYYFPLDGKIWPLVQIGVGYSSVTYKYIPKNGDNDKVSYKGPAFNLGAGISYFVTKKFPSILAYHIL